MRSEGFNNNTTALLTLATASPSTLQRVLNSPHWLGAFAFTLFFPGMNVPRRALLLLLALVAGYQWINTIRNNRSISLKSLLSDEPLLNWFIAWGSLACASLIWTLNASLTGNEIYREILFAFGLLAAIQTARNPLDCLRSASYASVAAVALLAVGALIAGNASIPSDAAIQGDWLYVSDAAWKSLPRAIQPAGPGVLSTQLLMVLLLFATLFVIEPTRWRTRLGLLLLVLALPLAFSTSNRMFWLALGLGAAPLIWAYTAGRLSNTQRVALAILVIALCTAILVLNTHQKWQQIYGNGVQGAAQLLPRDERLQLWPAVFNLIGDHPFLGYGFGNSIAREQIFAAVGKDYHHGHNFFLNATLQLGVLGTFMSLALVGLVGQRAAQAVYGAGASSTRIVAGYLMLAWLLAFVTKNATDDFVFREAGLSTWMCLGLALALARRRDL
jgi:O-antigen ligase